MSLRLDLGLNYLSGTDSQCLNCFDLFTLDSQIVRNGVLFRRKLSRDLIGLSGDAFDLAEVGLAEARWVRIRDLGTGGEAPSAGFDLDAVGAVHFAP